MTAGDLTAFWAGLGIQQLPLFIGAGLLLNLTPGPDVFYILSHGLRSGARAGVVAALGITAGCCVHIVAAALGLSALIAASATAFAVLKWVGAAYLLWVGLQLLRPRPAANVVGVTDAPEFIAKDAHPDCRNGHKYLWKVFRQGFWTNVLNPKVALFFLAFLPQFIGADAAHPTLAFLLLGLVFNCNGLWVNVMWGLTAAWLARRAALVRRSLAALDRVAGAVFVGFAVKLALSDNPRS